jgi:integrase/recombinase XerD
MDMIQVSLKPMFHRNAECIGIYFEKNAALQQAIQKSAGAKWSKTHSCWYLSCTGESYLRLKRALENKAELEIEELRKFLLQKKKNDLTPSVDPGNKKVNIQTEKPAMASSKNAGFPKVGNPVTVLPKARNPTAPTSKENQEALQKFKQQLILKSYSPSTIRTYTNEFVQFLHTIKDKQATGFTITRIKDYLQYCHATLKLSEATLHSRMNALKFYYEQVLHQEKFFWEIPRPKKPDQLPKVLGENEIGRMFNSVRNLKHKAILFTAYSAGLRVSEVINLKIKDVDSERMQLFIEKSKGKKDRYVGLSILLLDVLRAYLKSAAPRPVTFVFENPQRPGECYSIRSAQQIFHDAKEKARINKNVGIHSLRHSFATHLLEKGIDIRYIKDLLGHFSIKTTERYLHVKKETLVNIPNVLDELNKSITLDW